MKYIKELPEIGKYVVLFVSDHCPHCKQMEKTIKQIEKRYTDKNINFYSINISKNPEIATKYGIMSVPFTAFMNGRRVVGKEVGSISTKALELNLNDLLKDGEFLKSLKNLFRRKK